MTCTTIGCGHEKTFARGLCQACYYRLRRNGSVSRKNVVRAAYCVYPGCTANILGKNLCTKHYRAQQHELNAVWKLLRSRNQGQYPLAWDTFAAFLADVGERPSSRHKFKRIDGSEPYSKDNVRWKAAQPKVDAVDQKVYHAAYGREWNLQNKFGIDGAEYSRMLEAQGHACAICRQPESAIHHRSGEVRALAVDHDHETDAVRGLLCRDCNTLLGLAHDQLTCWHRPSLTCNVTAQPVDRGPEQGA